jgi:hypothetical protein
MTMMPLHPLMTGIALAAALGLQACSPEMGPARGLLTSAGGQVPAAPDFVANSRPNKLDYIPVGTSGPDRSQQARSAAEVAAAEAEMEAVRARNEAQGAALRRAGQASPAPRTPSTATQP